MSSRRARRQTKNQNPLIEIKDYFDSENATPKLKGKKKSKNQRKPLGELPSNIPAGLPEIPVKISELGCPTLDNVVETTDNGIQTEQVTYKDKHVQTQTPVEQSIHYRMCTEEDPPIEYWQILAEQRRVALIEALNENEELYAEIDELKSQVKKQNVHKEHANYFSFMYKLSNEKD